MWAALDPQLKPGVSPTCMGACIAAQFPNASVESISFDEAEAHNEDGSVLSTGSATIKDGGQQATQPVTFEVVERSGGWFIVVR